MNDDRVLKPEDYVEPACVLCGEPYGAAPTVKAIPQQRIIEKMNEYMSRRDYAGAERHLLYWLEEARLGRDQGGELMLRNELVGHYRKVGNREQAFLHAKEALRLVDELGFAGTVSAGTTYTNVATAYNAFGANEEALVIFQKAKEAYEASPHTAPELLGGLYNNMALVLVAAGRFREADALYEKALSVMADVPGGCLEQAITYLNMADARTAEYGPEEAEGAVNDCLEKASALLLTGDAPHDGYYAFVCEKCAPTFSYYGWFLDAEELNRRAETIYRENGEAAARDVERSV